MEFTGITNNKGGGGHQGSSPPAVSPRAWIASAYLCADGTREQAPDVAPLLILAASVNEMMPATVHARLNLMRDVFEASKRFLRPGLILIVVFPGGYFGFDARQYIIDRNAHRSGLTPQELEHIRKEVPALLAASLPEGSHVAFGVDNDDRQQVWVASTRGIVKEISRASREVACNVGSDAQEVHAAFFVCSDVAGFEPEGGRLDAPLNRCRLFIDLAHLRVQGTVRSDKPSPRWIHERALNALSAHGAAVLVHHHGGATTQAGHVDFRHQSNWIIYKQGPWVDQKSIISVP